MKTKKIVFNSKRIWALCLLGFLFCSSVFAQKIKVTGVVSDMNGGIAGITVMAKGSTNGTISGANGLYSIDVSSDGILSFTCIGYEKQELSVNGIKVINVIMKEDVKQLNDVVLIGYGSVKKSDLTGSVSSIKADELTFPTSSVTEMLRGKAAGVQISLTSGRPGSGSSMLIRGKRSLSGGNSPLYLVDGAVVETINDINPNDIASIEILKDASSQAIYGARAANGVVLLSTKRGKSEKTEVTFDSYFGTQKLWKNFDFYNADEFYNLRWESLRNDKGYTDADKIPSNVLADPMMEEMYASRSFVDWNKLMFKSALSQQYNLGIRGGNDKVRTSFSLGYLDQDGMVDKSGYQRANFRLNVDYKATKQLSIGANTSFSKTWTQTEDGSFEEFITRPPIAKVFNEDGSLTSHINSEGLENPLYKIQESEDKSTSDRLNMNLFLDFAAFKGFNYRINGSYRTRFSESGTFQSVNYPKAPSNAATLSNTYYNNVLLENIVTYKTQFGENHKLDFTIVQSLDKDNTRSMSMAGTNLPVDFFTWNGLGDASEITSISRGISDRMYLSFLGRINYSLFNKYLFTVAIRRDGASVFGVNHKWGNFPSAAFAWKMSDEEFIKTQDWISALKLRVSYGTVGNQGVDPYSTLGVTSSYDMVFGDNSVVVGYLPGSMLMNPELQWESTSSANYGLDFAFLDHRFDGSFEYYNTHTNNLLVQRSVTSTSGYTSMMDNLGETQTYGYEFSLNTDIVRSKNFQWSVAGTFSLSRNQILKVNDKVDEFGKPMDDIDNSWYIGQPINVNNKYIFDGIYQLSDDADSNGFVDYTVDTNNDGVMDRALIENAKPGDIKLRDLDGDGIITNLDRKITPMDPNWFGSLSTTFSCYGFDLLLDFYTRQGGFASNSYLKGGFLQGKLNAVKVNYWTPENASNENPRPNWNSQPMYNVALGYQNATYYRFRTLTAGYTLPAKLSKSMNIQKLRVYFTATNLWTKTDISSYSPELSLSAYPEPKQVVMGLNLQF